MPRVDDTIRQNISRPDFWLLNLDPTTAERDREGDLSAVIVSWLMILVPLIIIAFIVFTRF